jgi:hypothetical protein
LFSTESIMKAASLLPLLLGVAVTLLSTLIITH